MRARLAGWVRSGRDWLERPDVLAGLGTFMAVQGLKMVLESHTTRIAALEARGWVPLDDVATVGDLVNMEGRLTPEEEPEAPPAPEGAEATPEPTERP